jgi:hypothetical protein
MAVPEMKISNQVAIMLSAAHNTIYILTWPQREQPTVMGRAPLLGTPKDLLSKALEWASVSIGAPLLGNMEGRSIHRAFEINRYIKIYVKMSCKQASLFIGAPLGNVEGILLPGPFG